MKKGCIIAPFFCPVFYLSGFPTVISGMNAIKRWLISGSFHEGLSLYMQHGGKISLIMLFQRKGPTEWNTSKLRYELEKLKDSIPDESIEITHQELPPSNNPVGFFQPVVLSQDTVTKKYDHKAHYRVLPDELKTIASENIRLMKVRDSLSNYHLESIVSDQERTDSAVKLLNLCHEIDRNFIILDRFISTGEFPKGSSPETDIKTLTGTELMDSIIRIQKNLEKHLRELKSLKDSGKIQIKNALIQKHKATLEIYKQELNSR